MPNVLENLIEYYPGIPVEIDDDLPYGQVNAEGQMGEDGQIRNVHLFKMSMDTFRKLGVACDR